MILFLSAGVQEFCDFIQSTESTVSCLLSTNENNQKLRTYSSSIPDHAISETIVNLTHLI